jgi:hypothetical protein
MHAAAYALIGLSTKPVGFVASAEPTIAERTSIPRRLVRAASADEVFSTSQRLTRSLCSRS